MRIPSENSLLVRQRDLLPGLNRCIYVLLVILCLSATAFGQTATEGNDPDHLEAALQDDAVEEEYGARFIPPDSAIPNLGKLSGVRRIEPGSVSCDYVRNVVSPLLEYGRSIAPKGVPALIVPAIS